MSSLLCALLLVLASLWPTATPVVTPMSATSGWATWYANGPGLYGAVHSWRYGDRPYSVRVTAGARSVVVTVRDYCACGDRAGIPTVIDLSPEAFGALAPLSQGVVRVTVDRGIPLAPATDIEETP